MYKFIKTKDPDNKFSITNVEIQTVHDELTITDLLEVFEDFLRACGYQFKGKLDIIDDDE